MRPAGEQIMPGGRGREGLGRWGCLPVGVCLSVRAWPAAAAGDEGKGAASLTWVRGAQAGAPATRWLIGWPRFGVRPLSLIRPPAWPIGARAQADSGW